VICRTATWKTVLALATAWSCLVTQVARPGDELVASATTDELMFEAPALFPVLVERPPDFDPDCSYPAVVALHGFGDSIDSFRRVASAFTKAGFVVIMPEAPYSFTQEGDSRAHYSWGLNTWTPPPLTDDAEVDLRSSRLTVDEYLPAAIERVRERCNLDGIYYFGFSQGAVYAFAAGFVHRDEVGAILAFGLDGPGREWEPKLGGKLEEANEVPVFLGIGRSDPIVRLEDVQRHRDLLEEAGYHVTLRTFDGGHTVPQAELAEAVQWLRAVHDSRPDRTGGK
jgi:predicted esterase